MSWSRQQVIAIAPDASALKAAQGVAIPSKWADTGARDDRALWGSCKGSGSRPYRVCVDVSGPAFRCTCPSRKFPCKHALALLLLWSEAEIPTAESIPDWVREWLDERAARAERQRRPRDGAGDSAGGPADPVAAERRARQREERVAAGVDELDRWLLDQVRVGLASAERFGYDHWDEMARRLIDAQAPGLAGRVGRAAGLVGRVGRVGVGRDGSDDRAGRLLTEYALLRLLVHAYRRRDELPASLVAVVRRRIGFNLTKDEVIRTGETVSDHWDVIGSYDEIDERLVTRTCWLRGRDTGRMALVLSFAPPGGTLDSSLVVGTVVDADLAFYPGLPALRAVVVTARGASDGAPPKGATEVDGVIDAYASALADDPWTTRWPVVLASAVPARDADGRWHLADGAGRALPLADGSQAPWRLIALAGGRPLTVACEWTPAGLAPLTAWADDARAVVVL